MPQSLSQLWIHIIFSTKRRYPFLKDPGIRQQVYDHMQATCRHLKCRVIVIGGTEDHIHLLTCLNKNVALAELVEKIKKSSSKWVKKFSAVNDDTGHFYWQRGYGAFSVSQSKLNIVKRYIENQYEHHQKQSFQEELRKFLTQHTIKYKEEYIWD